MLSLRIGILFLMVLSGLLADRKDIETFPVHSVVSLKADMEDGITTRLGLGTIINTEGYVLTNAALVYDHENALYPDYVMMSVIDDVDMPIVCFAQMEVLALDSDRNLALLKPLVDTDIYCNPLDHPAQHHQQFFADHYFPLANKTDHMTCPLIHKKGTPVVLPTFPDQKKEEIQFERGKILDYVIQTDDEERSYVVGYQTDARIFVRGTGGPVFDEAGHFIGVAVYQDFQNKEKVAFHGIISRPVIVSWLCDLDRHNIAVFHHQIDGEKVRIHQHPVCQAMEKETIYQRK